MYEAQLVSATVGISKQQRSDSTMHILCKAEAVACTWLVREQGSGNNRIAAACLHCTDLTPVLQPVVLLADIVGGGLQSGRLGSGHQWHCTRRPRVYLLDKHPKMAFNRQDAFTNSCLRLEPHHAKALGWYVPGGYFHRACTTLVFVDSNAGIQLQCVCDFT